MTPQALDDVTKVIVMLKTDLSCSYFIGTSGQYAGANMDDAGNGVDKSDWGDSEIPQRPLQTLIISGIERDEFGCFWGRSNGQLVELFFQSEGESEFETIRNGYREVMWTEGGGGRPARFEGDCLYCQARDIGDEV
jgi:hypothetical protein